MKRSAVIDANGTTISVLADPRETDPDSIGAETARQLGEFKKRLSA